MSGEHEYQPPTYRPAALPRLPVQDDGNQTRDLVRQGEQTYREAADAARVATQTALRALLSGAQRATAVSRPRIPRSPTVPVAVCHRRRAPRTSGESPDDRMAYRRTAIDQHLQRIRSSPRQEPTQGEIEQLRAYTASLAPHSRAAAQTEGDVRRQAAHARRVAALDLRIRSGRLSHRDRQWIGLLRLAAQGDHQAVERLARIQSGERTPQPEQQATAISASRSPEQLRAQVADAAEIAWLSYWGGTIEPSTEVQDHSAAPGALACPRGRILDHGGFMLGAGATADEIHDALLAPSEGVDCRRPIGHDVITWHDDVRHLVTDEDRCWAARAALAARGQDPERTRWFLGDHSDDGRLHLLSERVVDGRIHTTPYHVPVSAAICAVLDRIATGRDRPIEDAPPLRDPRAYASMAAISDGTPDPRVASWRTPGRDGVIEVIDMSGGAIAERIARLAGPPPPGIALYGAPLILSKPAASRSQATRLIRYVVG